MITPNLQDLTHRIHEQNKAAGWWDNPRPRVQTAWLVITELAEATEAERAGRYANIKAFEASLWANEQILKDHNYTVPDLVESSRLVMWAGAFKMHIKDTFEDEIADAVIRLLDFAGSVGAVVSPPKRMFREDIETEYIFFLVAEFCNYAAQHSDPHSTAKSINTAIAVLISLSDLRNIDLWHHVELKLKYNATRGKMHGGKKF